jgi:hypothetical protein
MMKGVCPMKTFGRQLWPAGQATKKNTRTVRGAPLSEISKFPF